MSETATQRGDRVQRERMDKVRPLIEDYAERMIRLAGVIARDSLMGVSPHVAGRTSRLPRELREWVQKGCRAPGAAE